MRQAWAAFFLAVLSACDSLPPRKPTYHRDVAPLLAAHCQECHHRDGIAPLPTLADYESARSYGDGIRLLAQARAMPPWLADNSGACGTWQDARWLTAAEISTLTEWQEDGAPEGEPDTITGATALPTPFRSDAVLDIGGVYHPGLGSGGNRCFLADPQLDRDRLLTAIRVVSDDTRAVAQVSLFALDSDAAETMATALDAAERDLGYSCFGTARVPDSHMVASWSWPTPALRMPAGVGVRLASARKVVVQIHYNIAYTSSNFASGTQVELELDDQAAEARVVPISADGTLAPGLDDVTVDASQPVAQQMRVVAIAPRMHIRGKSMSLRSERGSSSTCLGNFGHWNVYYQQLFRPTSPKVVMPNDNLHISCAYGTLGRTEPVVFGDGIDDEECVAYLFVTD